MNRPSEPIEIVTSSARGLLLNWFDLAQGSQAAFDAWHNREHVIERTSIPGFIQGRRFTAIDAAPAPGHSFMVAYDTADLGVLASPAYFARLDSPTPLTRQAVSFLRDMTRTAYEVVWSAGRGTGGFVQTIRVNSLAQHLGSDGHELTEGLAAVYACDGVVGVQLGSPDGAVTHIKDQTTEGRSTDARSRADYPWCLVVETNDRNALAATLSVFESAVRKRWPEASHKFDVHTYQLVFSMTTEPGRH